MKKNKSLHILMILKYLPPLFSGSGKQALFLAKALEKEGAKLKMISMVYKEQLHLLNNEDIYNNIDIIRITVPNKKKLKYIPFNLKIILFLFLHKKEIDIVHLHSAWRYNFIILLTAKILRIPIIIKLTLFGDDDPIGLIKSKSLMRKMSGLSLRFFDAVICNSIALFNNGLEANLPSNKLVHIPNGVDLKIFKPVTDNDEKKNIRRSKKLPIEEKILLFVGRVGYRKGADILFEVWKKLLYLHSNIILLVIGPYSENKSKSFDDPTLKQYNYLFQDPENRIIFLGPVENIHQYIKSADLLFFPSRREGLPNVLLEALACGIPVIARRLEGITDKIITTSHLGFLFDGDDPEFLCNLILEYINNPSKFSENKNRRREFIREYYSIEKVVKSYLNLYNMILYKIKLK